MLALVQKQTADNGLGYSASVYVVSPLLSTKIFQIINRSYTQLQRLEYKNEHDQYFNGQTGICSSIIYCRCNKHDTMAVLFVKPEHGDKYVLPGGRRDKAGEGRAKHLKQDESCWQAIQGEFSEEVGESITNYCPQPCPFFTTTISKTNRNEIKNVQLRNIRTYFFETQCDRLPNKEYGRFRLYETTARLWISLEDIVRQFRFTYYNNRYSMSISPIMFQTFKHFASIVINQLRIKSVPDVDLQIKVFKTVRMLEQLLCSSNKTKLPSQIPFQIKETSHNVVITDFLLQ